MWKWNSYLDAHIFGVYRLASYTLGSGIILHHGGQLLYLVTVAAVVDQQDGLLVEDTDGLNFFSEEVVGVPWKTPCLESFWETVVADQT